MVEPTPIRPAKRVRYTKAAIPRGAETEPISVRADVKIVRQIDEILAAQLEVDLRTRSDVFQDALAQWLSTWYDDHPDKFQSQRDEWELERKSYARTRRDEKLEQLRSQVTRAKMESDQDHLKYLLSVAVKLRITFNEQRCSPKEKSEIDSLVSDLRLVTK